MGSEGSHSPIKMAWWDLGEFPEPLISCKSIRSSLRDGEKILMILRIRLFFISFLFLMNRLTAILGLQKNEWKAKGSHLPSHHY